MDQGFGLSVFTPIFFLFLELTITRTEFIVLCSNYLAHIDEGCGMLIIAKNQLHYANYK